jgi:hypothetical protein
MNWVTPKLKGFKVLLFSMYRIKHRGEKLGKCERIMCLEGGSDLSLASLVGGLELSGDEALLHDFANHGNGSLVFSNEIGEDGAALGHLLLQSLEGAAVVNSVEDVVDQRRTHQTLEVNHGGETCLVDGLELSGNETPNKLRNVLNLSVGGSELLEQVDGLGLLAVQALDVLRVFNSVQNVVNQLLTHQSLDRDLSNRLLSGFVGGSGGGGGFNGSSEGASTSGKADRDGAVVGRGQNLLLDRTHNLGGLDGNHVNSGSAGGRNSDRGDTGSDSKESHDIDNSD